MREYVCVCAYEVRKEQKVHVQLNNVTEKTDSEVHVTQLVVLVTL